MPRRSAFAIVLIFATSLVAAGCGSGSSSSSGGTSASASAAPIPGKAEPGTFQLGTQPWIGYGPFTLAAEQGIFEEEGLDVKTTSFNEDKEINAAIAGGSLDGLNAGTIQALEFAQAGLPIKIVAVEDVSETADAILANESIHSVTELKGKTVAYEQGTTGEVLLRYALEQNGLSLEDVQTVPIPAPQAGPALIAGKVDAAYTYEPFVTSAVNEGKGIHTIYTASEKPGIISDVLAVSEDAIENKPGQVAALVRSWQRALEYYEENQSSAQAAIANNLGTKPSELTSAFEGIEFFDVPQNEEQLKSGKLVETLQTVSKVAAASGILDKEINVEEVIDPRFVEAAAK